MKSISFLAIILATLLVSCQTMQINTPTATPDLSNIPTDIPIYPDPIHWMVLSQGAAYQAHADLQTITKFYQTEMLNQGWSQSQEPITYDTTAIVLHYEKADRKVLINIETTSKEGILVIGIGWE